MNPLQRFEILLAEIATSQIRNELYLSGLFSMALADRGMMTSEQLVLIIEAIEASIMKSIEAQEEARKARAVWPAKNLAA